MQNPTLQAGVSQLILQKITKKLVVACLMSCGLLFYSNSLLASQSLVYPGSIPADWVLPERAVDSKDIPTIKLDAKAADDKPLAVYKLDDKTYFLYGNIATVNSDNRGWNGNAGFVVTREGVLVIDSLGTPKLGKRMIATIRSITDKPVKYLVITHNHPDHAYGAAPFMELEGVTVIAHKGIINYNNSQTITTSVEYRREKLGDDMKGFKPVKADIYIDDDPFSRKEIRLGEEVFYVYNTGMHHSHGDLVLYQVNKKILWVSDLVFNQRTTYMGDGNSRQILRAHKWLQQTFKDISLMVPGHGSAQTSPFPMLTKTNDYVRRMRENMRNAVENGVSLYDAVKDVEFEDWKGVRLYEENQRANANFVYREMEQEYFEKF